MFGLPLFERFFRSNNLFNCNFVQVCKVDRQEKGLLPSYSFILMVIHYLQQVEPPVLPVVHELIQQVIKTIQ